MTPHINQIKRLSWILLASLSVNVMTGSFLFYWVFKERPPIPVCENYLRPSEAKPLATDGELAATLQQLKELSIEQLMVKLSDKRVVENGFTVGDLSLAALAGFYYFDIDRALSKQNHPKPLEQKLLSYGPRGETLVVYPTLSDADFLAIETFVRQEKWPFRAQGLFRLMKNEKFKNDPTLQEAFYLTPEYLSVERILSRSSEKIDKQEILALILTGEWGKVAAFHETQRTSLDLSDAPRRLFLLDWIHQGSSSAAQLLFKGDREFALKKLDDKSTVQILSLLKDHPEVAKAFSEELLKSPRSEMVRRAALTYVPEPVKIAIKPPIKSTPAQPPLKIETPKQKTPSIKSTPAKVGERVYIVQPNDSLWKIAKKFNVSIETIRKMNGLTSDELKPGRPLRLPVLGGILTTP